MKSDREPSRAVSRFAQVNPYWETFLDDLGLDMTGARGEGCYIETADGRVLLDCLAGFGTANLGHAHASLTARFTQALQRTSVNVFPFECADSQRALADRLLALSGGRFQKVFFATTGAEAVESAVKFAMTSTGRGEVVSFRDSFHGLSMFASFMTGNPFWTEALPWKPDNVHHVEADNFAALEDLLASRRIAAVVFEPVAGSSAAQHWTAETSAWLAALCRSTGTKLIADEVYCGLGRTGAWFGVDAIGMAAAPDMIVVSKGLTGGLVPLSAVLMNDGDFDTVFGAPGKAKVHGSTFGGNRLAMQCGLIVLDLVESGRLVDHAAAMGELMARRIAGRFDGRLTLRGKGLALSIEPRLEPGAQCDIDMTDVWLRLIDVGVLAMPNSASPGSLRLSPPLIFGVDEVELLMDRLDEALQE